MKKEYKKLVLDGLSRTADANKEVIRDDDIQHLPDIVQKYLRLTGVVGREKLLNFRLVCAGGIRSSVKAGWMKFRSEQYNFFDEPSRFFYITATKMGIPAKGMHIYRNTKASMVIKMAGILKIVDARGPEMDQAETVTLFNDMCVLAPATLISRNIKWEEVDPLKVRASFTNGNIIIGADLSFRDNGEMINFISNDRYETTDGKVYHNYPWSTPLKNYVDFGCIKIASEASLIFHRPEGEFCYGEFSVKEVNNNCIGFF